MELQTVLKLLPSCITTNTSFEAGLSIDPLALGNLGRHGHGYAEANAL